MWGQGLEGCLSPAGEPEGRSGGGCCSCRRRAETTEMGRRGSERSPGLPWSPAWLPDRDAPQPPIGLGGGQVRSHRCGPGTLLGLRDPQMRQTRGPQLLASHSGLSEQRPDRGVRAEGMHPPDLRQVRELPEGRRRSRGGQGHVQGEAGPGPNRADRLDVKQNRPEIAGLCGTPGGSESATRERKKSDCTTRSHTPRRTDGQ